ncbi:MAG: precorrin-3B C(17)-methyltransferase [Neorhizobium sp.]|nr:precorrin-3B C(17)-methyltransferase [Neorhizobium sp.]
MSGSLSVVGLGPGSPQQLTPEALDAVASAEDFFGYFPYIDRLNLRPDQRRHASDNREELDRARAALAMAAGGRKVCIVSGGDPGVFAMAAAVCEAIDAGPVEWREIELSVVPGVTAMLAVAAKAGAPLGHDFCAISLSNNLKPWSIIERRLIAAAEAGFVMAFYNPISKARPHQLGEAFDILRRHLPGSVPVIFGRAAGRPDEAIRIVNLAEAEGGMADMATCVIVGTQETQLIERAGERPLVYSPRSWPGPKGTAAASAEGKEAK